MTPTRYTVTTTETAGDELVTIWLNHPADRAAVTRASHQFDIALRHDPTRFGDPAPTVDAPTRRYAERYPLGVYFDVSEPDRLASIVRYVWLTRKI